MPFNPFGAMRGAMKAAPKPSGMQALNKGIQKAPGMNKLAGVAGAIGNAFGRGGGGGVGNKAAMLAQRQQPQQPPGLSKWGGMQPPAAGGGFFGGIGNKMAAMGRGIGPSAPPAPPPEMNYGAPPMMENFAPNDQMQPKMAPPDYAGGGDQLQLADMFGGLGEGGGQQPVGGIGPQMPQRKQFQNFRPGNALGKRPMY